VSKNDGGVPWPIWAIVTILVAIIGAYVTLKSTERSPVVSQEHTAESNSVRSRFPDIIGIYIGQSLNKTAYGKGKTTLDIQEIDRQSGKLRAYITWSEGLYGEGSLYGRISGTSIELSGTIISDIAGIWDCDLQGNYFRNGSIKGTYRVYPRPGNPNGTQSGEFSVSLP